MIRQLYQKFLDSTGVITDTRKIKGGEIFFALRGETFNGNDYISEALDKGCCCAVSDEPALGTSDRVLQVQDTLRTLQDLAAFHRKQWNGKILAITGSNGKTTTKELVYAVLARKYKVLATTGNLNNHIGVPLTLLSIRDEDLAVIEMGANHPGEIATLCEIAAPDAGIITNVGKAHLEGFGSLGGVFRAKGELYDYLSAHDGTALVNVSAAGLKDMATEKAVNSFNYGLEPGLDISGEFMASDNGITGSYVREGRKYMLNSPMFGGYNFMNMLAAAAAGSFFGVPADMISGAVEEYLPSNNRSQVINGKTNTLILDAYNANPTSMQAALGEFIASPGKKMIILGSMFELGEYSSAEHQAVLDVLKNSGIDSILLVGEGFYEFSENPEYEFRFFLHLDECIQFLEEIRPQHYRILIKGSRKNALEKTTKCLEEC